MVLRREANAADGGTAWLCRCDCGVERTVAGVYLRRGFTRSCGCLKEDTLAKRSTKHGHAHAGSLSKTYNTWIGMVERCTNEKHVRWDRYGGRGIKVCGRWRDFRNFLADMGEKPDGMTIEREDNDGNYEPGNCKWATRAEQAQNKSSSRILECRGRKQTVAQWSRELGISQPTIATRLQRGWSEERTLTTPVRPMKKRAA